MHIPGGAIWLVLRTSQPHNCRPRYSPGGWLFGARGLARGKAPEVLWSWECSEPLVWAFYIYRWRFWLVWYAFAGKARSAVCSTIGWMNWFCILIGAQKTLVSLRLNLVVTILGWTTRIDRVFVRKLTARCFFHECVARALRKSSPLVGNAKDVLTTSACDNPLIWHSP